MFDFVRTPEDPQQEDVAASLLLSDWGLCQWCPPSSAIYVSTRFRALDLAPTIREVAPELSLSRYSIHVSLFTPRLTHLSQTTARTTAESIKT